MLKLFFPDVFRGNVAFVAEPDELTGVLCHIPYHLQEVDGVLSNRLTKGQTLGTHMEPKEQNRKETKANIETSPAHSDIYILR